MQIIKFIRSRSLLNGLIMLALGLSTSLAQAFDSGSTGANGPFPPIALPLGTTQIVLDLRDGTVVYLPDNTTATLPAVPGGGFTDGIVHFTTIDVPSGVTLSFAPNALGTPVSLLAQGDVTVSGIISLSGEAGGASGNSRGGRGGPGGFKGGNGEIVKSSPGAGSGLGPGAATGAGPLADSDGIGGGGGGGYGTPGANGQNASPGNSGPAYGTTNILPMLGGSGGSGGTSDTDVGPTGGGGGGGGGALLIASSAGIDVQGSILAKGGKGGNGLGSSASSGGGGSGGAIRLMAEILSGNGSLDAGGGAGGSAFGRNGGVGGLGRIRLEAVTFSFAGSTTGVVNNGGIGAVFLPSPPSVLITAIGGGAVTNMPTGNIGGTDIVLNSPGTITIDLVAANVPVGTSIAVTAKPETDGITIGPVLSPGLSGTFDASSTTVDLTFPSAGLFFIEARATFETP